MSVLVRRAGRRDLDAIHALWKQLREQQWKLDPRLEPASGAERAVRSHREVILADPRSAFFVAEEKGVVLGYLHARAEGNELGHEPARFGVIVDVIVEDARRRQGIGARLIGCAVEWFRSLGLGEYRALAPSADAAARVFLERAGASPLLVVLRAPL